MSNEDIKKSVEECFEQIKSAESKLVELRKICPHEQTFIGDWSYGAGRIVKAKICSNCFCFIERVKTLTP